MTYIEFSSVTQSCPTLCDLMNCNTPGLPVHHQLNGHELEQTLGDGEGQGSLEYCIPWGPKAEVPILWPPDVKSWLIGKDPDAGKDWAQEEKGMTEHEMVSSLIQWTLVWAGFGSWWWTGKPGVLKSTGSLRVGRDWARTHKRLSGRQPTRCLSGASWLTGSTCHG